MEDNVVNVSWKMEIIENISLQRFAQVGIVLINVKRILA